MRKNKLDLKWLAIIGLGILFSAGVFAYSGVSSTVIENAENVAIDGACSLIQTSEDLGLRLGAASDFCDGTEATTNLCVVDISKLTIGGTTFDSSDADNGVTITGTTTPSKLTYSGLDISLTQVATTTANNPAVAGYYCHSGSPLMVYNWWWEQQTANSLFGSVYTIGTTTLSDGSTTLTAGTNSFTNTSTATLVAASTIGTSTTGFLSLGGYIDGMYTGLLGTTPSTATGTSTIGSYYLGTYGAKAAGRFAASTTPWILNSGVCIVVNSNHGGASSTASYTTAGGFTSPVGAFHADLFLR